MRRERMSRPNSSDPQICRSEGGASRVAKLICAGSWGASQGAKTANTMKETTKTQPIAASGFRLASLGSEIAVVAIAVIAEASLANCGEVPGTFPVRPEVRRRLWQLNRRRQVFACEIGVAPAIAVGDNPLPLCMITA